jgi:hypothetical protein
MNTSLSIKWAKMIKQQKASGKCIAAWCRENNVPYRQFLRWRKGFSSLENLRESVELEDLDQIWMEITMHGAKCTFTKRFNRQAMLHLLEVLKKL